MFDTLNRLGRLEFAFFKRKSRLEFFFTDMLNILNSRIRVLRA